MATRAKTQMSHREYANKRTVLYYKQASSKRVGQHRRFAETSRFKLPTWSGFLPMRLFKRFADKVGGTLCISMASVRRSPSRMDSISRRSMPFVAADDSHREEAIDDCIEFINSSTSFSRSNSITTNCP